jgi:hypothetical protein
MPASDNGRSVSKTSAKRMVSSSLLRFPPHLKAHFYTVCSHFAAIMLWRLLSSQLQLIAVKMHIVGYFVCHIHSGQQCPKTFPAHAKKSAISITWPIFNGKMLIGGTIKH